MTTHFLNSLITLLATTSGRDKLCRLVQYLMRFLATGIRERAEGTALKEDRVRIARKMESLGGSLAVARKVLRFGREIGIIVNAVRVLREVAEGKVVNVPKALLKVAGDICLILFFLFDHYLYFSRIGLANNPKLLNTCDYLSNLFWLFQCIIGIFRNIVDYGQVLQTYSKKDILRRRDELFVDTFRNALDIPIAVGFMEPAMVSARKMGLLGVGTSVLGIYQIWQ